MENNPCVPLAHSMSLVVGENDREYEQPMLTKMQTNICNILKDFEATPIGISYEQLLRQFQPHQHYEIKYDKTHTIKNILHIIFLKLFLWFYFLIKEMNFLNVSTILYQHANIIFNMF